MSEIYEHQYLVFNVSDGPKVINDSLNTYGAEGWQLTTMITVGGGEHLVAWIVKGANIEAPDPVKTKENKIAALWSSSDEDGGKEE
jgi:hypothetical protein